MSNVINCLIEKYKNNLTFTDVEKSAINNLIRHETFDSKRKINNGFITWVIDDIKKNFEIGDAKIYLINQDAPFRYERTYFENYIITLDYLTSKLKK